MPSSDNFSDFSTDLLCRKFFYLNTVATLPYLELKKIPLPSALNPQFCNA